MTAAPFPTPLLDARFDRQRHQTECQRQRILAEALTWLTTHSRHYGIPHGYVFGSVTQPGRFNAHSDVDLAVVTLGAVGS